MKNVLLAVLFFICFQSVGQNSEKEICWQFGASGGITKGNISSINASYDFTGKNGFRAGFFTKYFFNPNFAIVTEIEFEKRGFTAGVFNFGLQANDTSNYVCWDCYYSSLVDYQSFYLTLPLYVEFHRQLNNFGIFFRTGLFYSLMLQSYQDGYEELFIDAVNGLPFADYGYEPGRYRNIFAGKVENVVNTYDAGMLFGLGASYLVTNSIGLSLDASFHLGIAGYFENPEMVVAQFKSSALKIGLFYKVMTRKNRSN
jgi:hypothetical protein